MAEYKHISRQNGDSILSAEWNAMGLKIQSLNQKFNEENSLVAGKLTIGESLTVSTEIIAKGNINAASNVNVAGSLSVSGNLTVTGASNVSGNSTVGGGIYAGNSDMYFPKADHNHSAIGNTPGGAAIENAKDYNTLMILGRNIGTGATLNRQVTVYDDLTVSRNFKVNSNTVCSGELSVGLKATIAGGIYAANSDMYFTKTDHKYTGIGNAPGNAAIENANDFNTLLILGRNIGDASNVNRQVTVYDDLTVARNIKANGSITAAGSIGAAGNLTASGSLTVSGNANIVGSIYAGNSDMYFTKTDHNHTGIGNTTGYAAIENSSNYNTLMILGRSVANVGRQIGLWDDVTVARHLTIGGNIVVNGEKPFRLVRYNIGTVIFYNTGVSADTHTAMIAGFNAVGGDIDEGGPGAPIIRVYMYIEGNVWKICADFKSHNNHEAWIVDVLFIKNEAVNKYNY
jgi:predicted acyltransferase (DUF342 family)